MNTRNRTKTLETLVNKVEGDTIADHLRDIGMAFSTWSRFVMFCAIASHDAEFASPAESRKCRDAPPASRASAKNARSVRSTARHRSSARVGFGSMTVPLRL
jgi:hypothetical protein